MPEIFNIQNETAVSLEIVNSNGNREDDAQITVKTPIGFEVKSFSAYIKDAKRILDKESKELNPLGIKRLLAALVYEVIGNDNFGGHN